MPEAPPGRGRTLLAAGTTQQWTELEAELGATAPVAELDGLLARLIGHILAGEPVTMITRDRTGKATDVLLHGLTGQERAAVTALMGLAAQQGRGAWYVPESLRLAVGLTDLPALLVAHGGSAYTVAAQDVVAISAGTGDAVVLWAWLLPALERLLHPLLIRSGLPGAPGGPGRAERAWQDATATAEALDLTTSPAYRAMAWGGDWAGLDRAAHDQLRREYVAELRTRDVGELARVCRVLATRELVEAFYRKATAQKSPLSRTVLTKPLQPALSGTFGGDWLGFLDYLGEQPAPNEEIHRALPEPRLAVPAAHKVAAAAAEHGFSEDQVAAMLAALTGGAGTDSPVVPRVAALRDWWTEFDAAHARQAPGMARLWGLVDDGVVVPAVEEEDYSDAVRPELARDLLPATLNATIDSLWETAVLPRWPERLVPEPHPHRAMAKALGAAVRFWEGCALTAWFLTEGFGSRTTLDKLGEYHERDLTALAAAGCPVPGDLLEELKAAEQRFGELEEVPGTGDATQKEIFDDDGRLVWTATISSRPPRARRDGFLDANAIITRHRRAWSQQYLESWLDAQWRAALTDISDWWHQQQAVRGKPPTVKQFATRAAPAANAWFGGRLDLLAGAAGLTPPVRPAGDEQGLAVPVRILARQVFLGLGGADDRMRRDWTDNTLARKVGLFLQLEAAGAYVTPKHLDVDDVIAEGDLRWHRYRDVVGAARFGMRWPDPVSPST